MTSTALCPSRYSLDGYTTPPQIPQIPVLPPLTQGRKFIDESDSDNDESNIIINCSDSFDVSGIGALDCSTIHSISDNESTNNVKDESFGKSNAIKRRINDTDKDDSSDEPNEKIQKLNDDKSELETEVEKTSDTNYYSDLKYIQCYGKTNYIRKQQKHRGIVNTNHNSSGSMHDETAVAAASTLLSMSSSSLSPSTSLISANNTNTWDRETCLKISYRKRLTDNFIQFALVIYEPANKHPRTQRNLLKEFQSITNPETPKTGRKLNLSSNSSSSKKEKYQQLTSSVTKKSLRF